MRSQITAAPSASVKLSVPTAGAVVSHCTFRSISAAAAALEASWHITETSGAA
jgi:hypothetical protein